MDTSDQHKERFITGAQIESKKTSSIASMES